MTGDRDDQGHTPAPPWHQSTPALLGASVAALTVIVLVVWGVVALTSNADQPQNAPIDFVEPTFSSTSSPTSTTTTQTITSTSPPVTTEIGLPTDMPGSSTPATSGSSSATTESRIPPHTRSERDDLDNDGDGGDSPTTRQRPRTNVTRTLYPVPGN